MVYAHGIDLEEETTVASIKRVEQEYEELKAKIKELEERQRTSPGGMIDFFVLSHSLGHF